MGKNAKLGIAAGVAVVLALLGMVAVGPLVGVGILILGGLGVAALYQRMPEDEDSGSDGDGAVKTKKKQLQGKKRLDALLEGGTNDSKTKARPAATPPPGGGLPTWGGPDAGAGDDGIAVVEDAPAADWDTWDSEWAGDADTDTITDEADNPLDNLDQLDDIDPIAEVERLDALDEEEEFDALGGLDLEEDDLVVLEDVEEDAPIAADAGSSGGAFSFTAAPAVINEDVESADDIMAASQATELELDEDAADSELAKLLAKVQARLAAYE